MMGSISSSDKMMAAPATPAKREFVEPSEVVVEQIKSKLSKFLKSGAEEEIYDLVDTMKDENRWIVPREMILIALDSKQPTRLVVSDVISKCITKRLMYADDIVHGVQEVLLMSDDLIYDYPKFYTYIAEFCLASFVEKNLNISHLKTMATDIIATRGGGRLIKEMLHLLTYEMGPQYVRTMWANSKAKFSDFLPPNENVTEFVQKEQLEYVESSATDLFKLKPVGPCNYVKLEKQIFRMLNDGESKDSIIQFITANVSNFDDKEFINRLINATIRYAYSFKGVDYAEKLKELSVVLLQRFVENIEHRELQCLFAVQVLDRTMEHPQNLLKTAFATFYDSDVISTDTFILWRDSKEEPCNKGVALTELRSILTMIAEARESDGDN